MSIAMDGANTTPTVSARQYGSKEGVSGAGATVGFLLGFPWLLLPLVLWEVAISFRDEKKHKDTMALLHMMLRGADSYACLVWLLRGFYSINDPYKQAHDFPLGPPKKGTEGSIDPIVEECVDFNDFVPGMKLKFVIGGNDFDLPERRMSAKYRFIYYLLLQVPRPRPDHRFFENKADYKALLDGTFQKTFKVLRSLDGVDPAAPSTVVKYFTSDFGAPLLTRTSDGYVVDFSNWESLPLKCGGEHFESYGGKLTFDADLGNVAITYKGKKYTADSPEWDRVRYTLMSTALMDVVIENHTVHVHMLNAAPFALRTRQHLDIDHPVYRFMRPFTLKTVAINEHARFSILGPSGILNHGMVLTYPSIAGLYERAKDSYRHRPLPEIFKRDGIDVATDDPARVPYAYEGAQIWKIIDDFVSRYIRVYYEDDAKVAADKQLTTWYTTIRTTLPATAGIPEAVTLQNVIDLLAVYVWNVTFYHDLTSQTGNTIEDYHLGASCIRREDKYGTFYPNVPEQCVTLLAHQLTTIESVKVTDNFHLWWLDRKAHEAALEFQTRLWAYHFDLKTRNDARDLSYNSMDPIFIETSVQT